MIFAKNKEVISEYTIEQCISCQNLSKRKFKKGDYLFQNTTKCPSCDGQMCVEKIFGEIIS